MRCCKLGCLTAPPPIALLRGAAVGGRSPHPRRVPQALLCITIPLCSMRPHHPAAAGAECGHACPSESPSTQAGRPWAGGLVDGRGPLAGDLPPLAAAESLLVPPAVGCLQDSFYKSLTEEDRANISGGCCLSVGAVAAAAGGEVGCPAPPHRA